MKTLSRYFFENIISYGMIAGLFIIIVRASVYLFDINQTNVSFGVLNFVYNIVVMSGCLYLGTVAWRKKKTTGNLTYGQGLLSGLIIGFIAILLIFVYDMIFHLYIAPDFLTNMLEPQIAAIRDNPAIPGIQKAELLDKIQKYASPFYGSSMNALVSYGISIVIAMIMAIFTVRKRPVING